MIRICSWCDKPMGVTEDELRDKETHGICPACLKEYFPTQAEAVLNRIGVDSHGKIDNRSFPQGEHNDAGAAWQISRHVPETGERPLLATG